MVGREPATEPTRAGSHLEAPFRRPHEVPGEETLDQFLTILARDISSVPCPLPRDPSPPEMTEQVSVPFAEPPTAWRGPSRKAS
jgi:hypothetical protein